MTAIRDAAGRRVHGELVAFPERDARPRFHLRVVHERCRESILEHVRRRGERLLDVAALLPKRYRFVPVVQTEIAFRPDLRRVRFERRFLVDDMRQHFVVDDHLLQRFFGKVPIHRSNRDHRFADESHGIIERVATLLRVLLHLVAVLLTTGNGTGAPDDLTGLMREDCLHAGHCLRFRHVNRLDARVRMRTPQDLRVEHARQLHVVRILRAPGDPLARVDARRRMADDLHLIHTDVGIAGGPGHRGSIIFLLLHRAPPAVVRSGVDPAATTAST